MSHTYSGNGTAVSPAVAGFTPVAIQSSTNATPIAVTFQVAHGFTSGDTVEVIGHATNTGANGIWQVLVTSPTVVTLTGSVGVAVGAATGYAVDYQLSPALTIPDDGDDDDGASIDPALEALANLAPFLRRTTGVYRLANIYAKDFGSGSSTGYLSIALGGSAAMTAQTLTGAGAPGLFGYASGTNPPPPAIAAGDLFEVDFVGQVNNTGGPLLLNVGLAINGGSYSEMGESRLYFPGSVYTSAQMHLTAQFTGSTVRTYWDMAIMAGGGGGASVVAQMQGTGRITVKHWRTN